MGMTKTELRTFQRASTQVRNVAVAKLIDKYPNQFAKIYEAEQRKAGIYKKFTPRKTTKLRVANAKKYVLESQLKRTIKQIRQSA